MAKKAKEDIPSSTNVPNRDIIQRLNFLYQASVYLDSIPNGSRKQRRTKASNLSSSYVDSMKIIGKKTMVKMDPSIKRTLCKGCSTILVPGTTASTRIKKSAAHGHTMVYTCVSCKISLRIPAPPVAQAHTELPVIKSRGPIPRPPPLFARDEGHVVFSGADKVPIDHALEGIFIV